MQLAGVAKTEDDRTIWRASALGWGLALAVSASLALVSGLPALTSLALLGTVVLALLVALGDMHPVRLADGGMLTPAPAMLIAAQATLGWPAALVGAVLGTLPGAARQPLGVTLRTAGARGLLVLLTAPIDRLTREPGAPPFSTPLGVLGLALVGALFYVLAALAAPGAPGTLRQRWRPRLRALRWYPAALTALGGTLAALLTTGPWAIIPALGVMIGAQHMFRGQEELRRTAADLADLSTRHTASGERLERLQSLSTTMIATRDVQQMLRILCERLAALLDAPAGWVVLADESGTPRLMASHNIPACEDDPDSPVDAEAYEALLRRGRVVLNADERRHDLAPAAALLDSSRWLAVLSIPLSTEQRTVGAICLAFDRVRGLDADEQRVLAAFAHQAAVTLENARLFDELRHKQAELIQSSKLAAVGTFAAGIAHEFNNLLGGMLGYAQLGRDIDDTAEKNRALEVVVQACVRGRGITRGLLTFARRHDHSRELSHVADAIDETLTLVEIDLRKSQIDIVRLIEPVPPTVCDVGQIAQVVLNLVTNARDAMRPDGGTLTIGLRENAGAIELSVGDTGSGIATHIRDRLFEPFVTTKGALGGSQTPGTGLGLSVSYGIIKDHGGEILVESCVGGGTTMTVRLPIVTEEQQAPFGAT
jgi:two-component system, NtrC family, sensor kinase